MNSQNMNQDGNYKDIDTTKQVNTDDKSQDAQDTNQRNVQLMQLGKISVCDIDLSASCRFLCNRANIDTFRRSFRIVQIAFLVFQRKSKC